MAAFVEFAATNATIGTFYFYSDTYASNWVIHGFHFNGKSFATLKEMRAYRYAHLEREDWPARSHVPRFNNQTSRRVQPVRRRYDQVTRGYQKRRERLQRSEA